MTMSKKLVSIVAASAIASTAAMAEGQHLIFPAFFADSNYQTTIKVVNKNDSNATVVKAVIYDGKDSHEIKDFNIYLSANDVTEFTIKKSGSDIVVTGTDGSLPTIVSGVEQMASTTAPMSTAFASTDSNFGYVILYTMTEVAKSYHGYHNDLRSDYAKAAKAQRGITGTVIFNNGVISGHVNDQVKNSGTIYGQTIVGGSASTYSTYAKAQSSNYEMNLSATTQANLFGYGRITDVTNGKDMIVKPTELSFSVQPIWWVEGEAATLLQAAVSSNNNGTLDANSSTSAFSMASAEHLINAVAEGTLTSGAVDYIQDVSAIYATYGESSSFADSQILITQPLKRHIIDANVTNNGTATSATAATVTGAGAGNYYAGATYTKTGAAGSSAGQTIVSYLGCMKSQLLIYDMNENQASASQFSPAQTPTLSMCNELASSEAPKSGDKSMSQFLTEAGYSAGYVKMNFLTSSNTTPSWYDAIVTQMVATTAGSKVVTNWFTPEID